MQALRICVRASTRNTRAVLASRCLTTASASAHAPNADGPSKLPWFIDPSDEPAKPRQSHSDRIQTTQQHQLTPLSPLPSGIPAGSIIRGLHARLSTSPFLEPGTLRVSKPVPTDIGPPLPYRAPQGKRKRGGTYAGEGMLDADGGIWEWIVVAQVKEGTEGRGAIESVVRAVRQTLLKANPPVPIPPRRKVINDGWAMIDAGDFSVHIVSKAARERFFPERRMW